MNALSLAAVAALVYSMLIVEARRAAANERRQRSRGGIEPPGDVYAIMAVAYPGMFAAMMAESLARGGSVGLPVWVAGLTVFALAKALKWWAILSLGDCWTFRVLVVPGTVAVRHGPYRFVNHPNYLAVVGEIAGVALMTNARVSGPCAVVVFGALMLRRITIETRALNAILRRR